MPADSHLFVIFGATGDLTRRKLLPALYHLMKSDETAGETFILGAARSGWTDEHFREVARGELEEQFSDDDLATWCDERLFYQSVADEEGGMAALHDRLQALEKEHDLPGNRVFYLSLPPKAYGPTIEELGESSLNKSAGWTRIVIEKPFGHDLQSAHALNELAHKYFSEDQVYRIDHYLAKETVQNLLAFRFGNAIFENLWNRQHIERVELTVAEDLGVGERAGYYDDAGQLRDMVQNHLTQLFTLIAMEPPHHLNAEAIRSEKVKVLESTRALDLDNVVLGQYDAGKIDGETVQSYGDEEEVPMDSTTETYVALSLSIENWRWQGVPFYLRTGKRLPEKRTQIAVHFRAAPVALFQNNSGADDYDVNPNVLLITLQPNEGFDLHFEVKEPGQAMHLASQTLRFRYEEAFGPMPDAYETLLRDIVAGDQTLFVHSDEVEASWSLYSPILEANLPVHPYPAGTWGPPETTAINPNWTESRR